jgi:hypothetical protein
VSVPIRFLWRSAALDPASGLSPIARLAVCVYAEHLNGTSAVLDPAPSEATLAERMGASGRTARRARAELKRRGWIEIGQMPGRASRIRVLLPRTDLTPLPRTDLPIHPGHDPGHDPGQHPGQKRPPNQGNQGNQENSGEERPTRGRYTRA